jgi:hypothetical protein
MEKYKRLKSSFAKYVNRVFHLFRISGAEQNAKEERTKNYESIVQRRRKIRKFHLKWRCLFIK